MKNLLILISVLQTIQASTNPDEVASLPGLNFKPKFRQFSGYLEAGDGVHLHYWMFESARDPVHDPVVFWFNGGPGSSSLLGALTENGPFRIMSNLTVKLNPYSWNTEVTLIYVESPAGVGFSYKDDKNYKTDDNIVAHYNYGALKSFFQKYPELLKNDFYITGESYGGVYVPTLSALVLDNKYPANFKGFAIGNPILSWKMQGNSVVHFLYHHALIDDPTWRNLIQLCCPDVKRVEECNFHDTESEKCKNEVKRILNLTELFDPYNIYDACYDEALLERFDPKTIKSWIISSMLENHLNHVRKNGQRKCQYPPQIDYQALRKWVRQDSVQKALHVKPRSTPWDIHDLLDYNEIYEDMTKIIEKLIDAGLRGLIYNGDFDTVCNYLGDRWFVEHLPYKATSDYKPWYHKDRVAGFTKHFGNLTFQTVMASGHMVPSDQPRPAQQLFLEFIHSKK